MDITATLDAPCPPESLHPWVDDLERYPEYRSMVFEGGLPA